MCLQKMTRQAQASLWSENKKERVEISLSIKIRRHIFDSDSIDNITRGIVKKIAQEVKNIRR